MTWGSAAGNAFAPFRLEKTPSVPMRYNPRNFPETPSPKPPAAK